MVDVGGTAITDNSDNADYYGAVQIPLPQGKEPYAVKWDSPWQGGVSLALQTNWIIMVCSKSIILPANRQVKVYYR